MTGFFAFKQLRLIKIDHLNVTKTETNMPFKNKNLFLSFLL